MTIPLLSLSIFIIWTMVLAILLIAARLRHLSSGGSPADFGDPTGNKLLWRLLRAQANCAENLPLYAGVVLILAVRGVATGAIDVLAILYITFRLLHSLFHLFNFNPNYRVACLGVQFLCLLGLLASATIFT
ncbi:MAPEG family protein [Oscillatoria sp. FACHB-1406]|uniref:MAPEG family protein n=1 Tax=Oscillatoria sp. FACHB-1406 TaxID=2692846 RepID=UPI001681EEEF|nr:MAPEG family protein [Oscillatoria sp. FACHB-1406]MBD2577400.1 MAPEG family protein [Oscillatoria sp. FACHB-1406]